MALSPPPVRRSDDAERGPSLVPEEVDGHTRKSSLDYLDQKADVSTEEEPPSSPSSGSIIDLDTFHQILDLDEDETHDFSAGMAWAYFDQAGSTFTKMESALENKNLAELSSLGHFLKGSSAALGVAKVQASCERMQHYGQQRDEEAGIKLSDDEALNRIGKLLVQVKKEYSDAEKWLKNWYKEHGVEQDA